jgi:hypothetical protein
LCSNMHGNQHLRRGFRSRRADATLAFTYEPRRSARLQLLV